MTPPPVVVINNPDGLYLAQPMPQTCLSDPTGLIWNAAPSFLVSRFLTGDDRSVSGLSDPVVLVNGPIGWLPVSQYGQIGLNIYFLNSRSNPGKVAFRCAGSRLILDMLLSWLLFEKLIQRCVFFGEHVSP